MTGAHEHIDVVIIGGGQAGLALSYYLKQQGRQHVIVEQARLWEAWQSGRWDSFALITPNARTFTLPGLPYTGDSPDGFSALQDIQNYLRRYAPGRYRGKSKAWWVPALGLPVFAEDGLAKSPLAADPGGGREYNPHQFARDGMTLLGRVIGARGSTLEVAPNLYDLLRASDRSEADFRRVVDAYVLREHLDVPDEPPAEVLDDGYRQQVIRELDVHSANITSIVWCTGYRFDFSWVHLSVFDEMGYPIHASGVTASPGLYFLGMHWRSRPVSAFVGGVAAEAAHIAAHIDARAMRPTDMRRVAGS